MPSIDQAGSSHAAPIGEPPEEPPHGFLTPPAAVRQRLELEHIQASARAILRNTKSGC